MDFMALREIKFLLMFQQHFDLQVIIRQMMDAGSIYPDKGERQKRVYKKEPQRRYYEIMTPCVIAMFQFGTILMKREKHI